MRLSERIMSRGVYPYRERAVPPPEPPLSGLVRLVSPEPPHEPEPHPDEPFAPLYDYAPLGLDEGRIGDRWPPTGIHDPVVFGVPYSVPPAEEVAGWPLGYCGCGAGWRGVAACWNCGARR